MSPKRSRQRLVLIVAILLALLTLLTSFAAVLHDEETCVHEHCLLCAFLQHKNDALQPLAAVIIALFGTYVLCLGKGVRTKTVLFTPVCLKVRMDR